jgi:hypothetical protein
MIFDLLATPAWSPTLERGQPLGNDCQTGAKTKAPVFFSGDKMIVTVKTIYTFEFTHNEIKFTFSIEAESEESARAKLKDCLQAALMDLTQ